MKIAIEVDQKLVQDVLVSGLEGGSGYWLQIRNDITPMGKDYIKTLFTTGLMVQDLETKKKVKLTKARIEKAVRLMAQNAPSHFGNMMQEYFDAETGDVLLQLAVNGKVLYG